VPIVVMNFGRIPLEDTDAITRAAAAIAAERKAGAGIVALLPAYGRAAAENERLAAAVSQAPVPRELDLLTSSSATMALALCAMALHRQGCRAVSLDGVPAGIVTDGTYSRAQVVEVRPGRLQQEIEQHGIVLVPAITGVARGTHEVTTLSPGGADVAAAALAAALGAQACLDVDELMLDAA
jgi:aspartate kinase